MALSDEKFTHELRRFLSRVKASIVRGKLCVAYDFTGDVHLLDYALDGFESPATAAGLAFDTFDLGALGPEYAFAVEDIFAKHDGLRTRRHHALIDARVNRDAYLSIKKSVPR